MVQTNEHTGDRLTSRVPVGSFLGNYDLIFGNKNRPCERCHLIGVAFCDILGCPKRREKE